MADRDLRTLYEGGSFFEGPRWHDGRWWVSDIYATWCWRSTRTGRP